MAKARSKDLFAAVGDRLNDATKKSLEQQQQVESQAKSLVQEAETFRLPLIAIADRARPDLRPVSLRHAANFAESFTVAGMLQPIICDRHDRLLCGAHRRIAWWLIGVAVGNLPKERLDEKLAAYRYAAEDSALFLRQIEERVGADRLKAAWIEHANAGVLVRRLPLDSADPANTELVDCIETIENTQRKGFSISEVKSLAERFLAAGYIDRAGRPKDGERSLIRGLETVFGVSGDTIRRYLGKKSAPTATVARPGISEGQILAWIRQADAKALGRVAKAVDEAQAALKRAGQAGKKHDP